MDVKGFSYPEVKEIIEEIADRNHASSNQISFGIVKMKLNRRKRKILRQLERMKEGRRVGYGNWKFRTDAKRIFGRNIQPYLQWEMY